MKLLAKLILIKLKKLSSFLKKNQSDYLFISAPENVAWLLNIRGNDNPIVRYLTAELLIDDKKKFI